MQVKSRDFIKSIKGACGCVRPPLLHTAHYILNVFQYSLYIQNVTRHLCVPLAVAPAFTQVLYLAPRTPTVYDYSLSQLFSVPQTLNALTNETLGKWESNRNISFSPSKQYQR